MAGTVQPLVKQVPIVNKDGSPTEYFIRLFQEKQIDISKGITKEEAQVLIDEGIAEWASHRDIIAGAALTGGGNLSSDVTLNYAGGIADQNDVDLTTPPTDQQVLVWDLASSKWVPADQSGSGGSGGSNQTTSLNPMLSLSLFSLVNITGTRSVTENTSRAISVIESSPSSGAKVAGIFKPVPGSSPYRVAIYLQPNANSRRYMGWAAGWTDGTKLHVVTDPASGAIEMMNMTTATSRSSSSQLLGSKSDSFRSTGFWVGLRDDGTNVFFEVSEDGVNFSTYFTVSKSSGWLGSSGYTNVFAGIYSEASDVSGASYPHSVSIRTWDEDGLHRGFDSVSGSYAPASNRVTTTESTSSTSYTNLATVGPSVTLKTGASVLMQYMAVAERTTGTGPGYTPFLSFEVSGATSIPASDSNSVFQGAVDVFYAYPLPNFFQLDGLTPGVNTFTLKYRVDGETFTFRNRSLIVTPL